MDLQYVGCEDESWLQLARNCIRRLSPCILLPQTFVITYNSFLKTVQTGSGANPTSSSRGKCDLSLEFKRPERQSDKPPLSSSEFKNQWCSTSTAPYSCTACTGTNLLLKGCRVNVRLISKFEWTTFRKQLQR